MTAAALALVLAAAGIHATWNFLVKRAGGGSVFTWLFTALSVVCYAPLAAGVVVIYRPSLGPVHFLFMAGAALLHTTYYLVLTRGYRTGDLSLVYPLARGTGPMLATAAAIGLLGERPTPLALWGALLLNPV
jgi:multidrug transporter EmrE-like cation transporter